VSSEHRSPFDVIRHEDDEGNEYWSARELSKVLQYRRWEQFPGVIAKAQEACARSGYAVSDHFREVSKMVTLGSGAQRPIQDWELSRYACYLVVQNADPSKPIVAAGQTYFAEQTRLQELAESDELAGLTEAQKRLYIRAQLVEHNKQLVETANRAGVVTSRDFAVFQDHGYRGLYGGERARDIAARKGLMKGEKILDWMGSTELAANLFRSTQAEELIRTKGITGKEAANDAHYTVGRIVRRAIAEAGNPMPEDLPTPAQSIQQLEKAEAKRRVREHQPSLFPDLSAQDQDA